MFRPHAPTIGAMTTTSDTPAKTSATSTTGGKAEAKKPVSATLTTGSSVTTQYGTTQVSVTIKSGKITDVKA